MEEGWWRHATHRRKMREETDRRWHAAESIAEARAAWMDTVGGAAVGMGGGLCVAALGFLVLWILRLA